MNNIHSLYRNNASQSGSRYFFGNNPIEREKRKAEREKRKAESGKRKAENGKRKAESGKRKAENGKRKAENGKQLSTFQFHFNKNLITAPMSLARRTGDSTASKGKLIESVR